MKWFVVDTFTELQAIVVDHSVGFALESIEKGINLAYTNPYSGRVSKALVVTSSVDPNVVVVIVEDMVEVSVE